MESFLKPHPFNHSLKFGLAELHHCLILGQKIFKAQDPYLTLSFFLEGKPQEVSTEEFLRKLNAHGLDYLTEIEHSFRITNIQNISTEIKEMCSVLSSLHKSAITCNLYFTPGIDRNCFDYHCDLSDSFIYQTLGSKKWSLPLKNGSFLSELGGDQFGFMTDPLFSTYEKKEIIISQNDYLEIPYAHVHKAELVGKGPSIHLNFSKYYPSRKDFIFFAINHLMGEMDKNANEKITTEEFPMLSEKILLNAGSLVEKFQMMQLKKEQGLMTRGLAFKPIPVTKT